MNTDEVARDHVEPVADVKLAIVLRNDLLAWQKLNVTAFLTSGFGTESSRLIGEPYRDASDRTYLSMLVSPVLVFAGDAAAVRRAFERATERSITMSVYTDDMFATSNDVDNRATVARVATADLGLAGFGLIGPRRQVDKALDKVTLHPSFRERFWPRERAFDCKLLQARRQLGGPSRPPVFPRCVPATMVG